MERFFKLKENNTNVRQEVVAGITTFMTMAYILIVNPTILSAAGMDSGAVFTATALSSIVATLIMGIYAKLPFAQAPGMGLNAFFAYTVVLQMGYSFEFALTAVLLEGLIFILLTLFNVREAIVDSIPVNIKKAISIGIGLFIALLGLEAAGVVIGDGATILALGDVRNNTILLSLIGIVITGILVARKVKGALFLGMIITTIIGIPMGVIELPNSIVSIPPSISSTFMKFEWHNIFSFDMVIVLFTLLFMDMFDTIGTLVGVATKANMLDENGRVKNIKKALFADAIGTTVGACLGTSTVSTFVESAAGVAEGGRTGLTSLTTALLFLLSIIFVPIISIIPAQATAPALIFVGILMLGGVKDIDFNDITNALPAFCTIVFMPFTYSIANGIALGLITYCIAKFFTGQKDQIKPLTLIIALTFVFRYAFITLG